MELNITQELAELFQEHPPVAPAKPVVFEEDELDEGDRFEAIAESLFTPDDEEADDEVTKDGPTPGDAHVPSPTWKPRKPKALGATKDDEVVVQVTKIDTDQRLVYGWASIIDNPDGTPHIDSQGDVLDEATLMKAAHDFMNTRELGDSHKTVTGLGKIVESLVVTKELKRALNLPASTPTGWLIGVKVASDGVWERVKKGELTAFSIGGTGIREPL